MSMVTKQEILEFWKKHETPEAKEERREVEALKKDLRIAQDSIQDAIARYRKAKLRARIKAKACSEYIFLPLEEYSSRTDIQDAYGYEMISETEYDRLMTLWELREQSSRKDGSYTDRVVEMLEVPAGTSGMPTVIRLWSTMKKSPGCTGRRSGSLRRTGVGSWITLLSDGGVREV